ncbi:hypothetical protein P2W68_07420 [Chryseobacterium arthrosphaerae]|uniref:hypothetical protein n=1 Tax=Chryseobacterium arthrosphaerae TaxID=651561 RepID=UPI0023E34024|nr:hypothetical protein [Chryseobacterium arthrosphaerae]WES99438.1 hypothetical protein P2W68_07420 [Chryseobacterium arthrosphaerae]
MLTFFDDPQKCMVILYYIGFGNLRISFGLSSVYDLFSEAVPKKIRRTIEENGFETCQKMSKQITTRHYFY